MLIPELLLCPCMHMAEDKNVLCCLLSFAAAEGGQHRRGTGLEENSVRAICSYSWLDSQ